MDVNIQYILMDAFQSDGEYSMLKTRCPVTRTHAEACIHSRCSPDSPAPPAAWRDTCNWALRRCPARGGQELERSGCDLWPR